MKDVEYVLEFAANLGSRMLTAGANLERANDTINRVCLSYQLEDISIFSLSSIIQLSARSPEGDYAYRQIDVASSDIHLELLNRLNRLSRRVCTERPTPSTLMELLDEAIDIKETSVWTMILGELIALTSLCVMYGGGIKDIIATDIIVVGLYLFRRYLGSLNLNYVVVNALSMFFTGTLAYFMVWAGIGKVYSIIVTTCSMMIIPGIPMVNAVRNMLCGNEMNGILELLKAVVETLAMVFGLFVSMYLFGGVVEW